MKPAEWTTAALDLLLGSQCVACSEPGRLLCQPCRDHLPDRPRYRYDTGLSIPVAAGCDYDPTGGKLVVAFKDHGAWTLAAPLAELLAQAVRGVLAHAPPVPDDESPLWLVPVPTDPVHVRQRGIDHTQMMAARAARLLHGGWWPVLAKAHRSADQLELGRRARRTAQRGTMWARPHPRHHPWRPGQIKGGGRIIVVDDVITTGATCAEAVRALEAAGYHPIGVAAAVQTPLRRGKR